MKTTDIASCAPENFFKPEIRSGHKISTEMKRLWACEINLLAEFRRVCEKNGLRWWLDSGSLLGAVRHKGYIPWDDDIDVVMFRDDYDRLTDIAEQEFRPPFIFQTAYTEKNYARGHAQLRDARTSAIIPEEIYKDFNQGIFIDSFVLDGVNGDPAEEKRQNARAKYLKGKLEMLARPIRMLRFKNLARAAKYRLMYPGIKGKARLFKEYEDIFRNNKADECDYVATLTFRADSKKRDRHIYDRTELMDFEFMKFPVPGGYDELLTLLYGDYMKPVIAPSMHGGLIVDTETPADLKIKELREREKCRR